VRAERSAKYLDVVVSDEGQGLPPGFSLERAERLGLQIVRTLVESELRARWSLRRRDVKGTEAVLPGAPAAEPLDQHSGASARSAQRRKPLDPRTAAESMR